MRTQTEQNNHKLVISFNRESINDEQALDAVMASLKRSSYESHHAILKQIEKQLEGPSPIVRFSMNPSAAARIERSLKHTYDRKSLYPNRGQRDLHDILCRALGIRLSHRQLSYAGV